MSQMTVNVVGPETPVPNSSGTPGTGVLTTSNFNASGTVVVGVTAVVLMMLIAALVVIKRHYNIKIVAGRSRWLAKGLVLLAIVTAAFSFSAMQTRYGDDEVKAANNNPDSLSISTEDISLDVEMKDEPVYAMAENKVTVTSATYAGYALSAYVTGADLASSDSGGVIKNLDGAETTSLADNTWGVALTSPEDENSEVFFGLSTDSSNPTTIKETSNATAENDENTLYYGTYVTPELPYGTYTGATINYMAVANFDPYAPVADDQIGVVFNGRGLKFENGRGQNRVNFEKRCGSVYRGETKIVKTKNIDENGVKQRSYQNGDGPNWNYFEFEGASRIELEAQYDFTAGTGNFVVNPRENVWRVYPSGGEEGFVSETIVVYNDRVGLDGYVADNPNPEHDYGYYIKVSPIYSQRRDNTEEVERCYYTSTVGDYEEPIGFPRYWTVSVRPALYNEDDVINYLEEFEDSLVGNVVTINAYNPKRVIYDGNGATAGTMDGYYSSWGLEATSGTTSLMAPNFYKQGYGFAGWSQDPTAVANGNVRIYGPNEKADMNDFEFSEGTNEAKLYAVWVESEGAMQDYDGCNNMSTGQVTALTDLRDGNVYTVGKMRDGHCWMMENLRLDEENSSDESLAEGFGGIFSGLAQSANEGYSVFDLVYNEKYTEENMTGDHLIYRIPRYNNNNTRMNDSSFIASPGGADGLGEKWRDNNNSKWFGYGNYYNWAAAMASTDDFYYGESSENAGTSICPKGWHLPAYRTRWEYSALGNAVSGWTSYPNNFVYSGDWDDDGAGDRGFYADYWSSSSISGAGSAVRVRFSEDYSNVSFIQHGEVYAQAVRCLADY